MRSEVAAGTLLPGALPGEARVQREGDPSPLSPRSDDRSASLQRERAAPPGAGTVLPLQWLAHHTPLPPECALDSLQSKGPDFKGTGEWWRGEAAKT